MKLKNLLNVPQSKYDAKTILKWLWQAWRGNQLQAVLNACIGFASVGVSLAQVWAVQHAIDVASGVIVGSIYWAVALMGMFILCDYSLNIASVWLRNILGIKAQNHMQQQMLDRILRSEWQGKESRHSGDVLNRLEFDVSNVVNFLTEIIPNTLSVLAMFIGAFFYLFSMDKVLAMITVAIIRRLTREVRSQDSEVQSVLQETIQNRMLIKTMEGEGPMVNRLEHSQSQLRHKVVRRTVFSVFSNLMLNLGFALGYLIAFLWAAVRMSAHTLTFGGMTAFLQLVARIQGPARNLTKLVPAFVSVFTAAERLMELEENPLEEKGSPIYVPLPCGVRLEHVNYAYDEADGNVINDLSFDFKPGSCTAILGETGAGKTTLVRIILALLRPTQGKAIIYHGQNSTELSPRLRCNFVYVPQGNTLMSGTIRDNLRLGKLDATDEEMEEALKKSCAEFVLELSEGQAQRIAIARALLRDRGIMLFDEATSALDPDTERQLLKNILASHDRTVIFITHRPAVVDYCDQTLMIEKI